jgi:hypothetical protein
VEIVINLHLSKKYVISKIHHHISEKMNTKIVSLSFGLLLFISNFLLAQRIIVVPMVEDWKNICSALDTEARLREANKQINGELGNAGYQVVDYMQIARRAKSAGICSKPSSEEAQKAFLELSKADIYFMSEINTFPSSSGTYITLTMTAYTLAGDYIFEQFEKTNRFMTDDIAALAKRAIKQMMPKIKENINNSNDLIAKNNGSPEWKDVPKEVKLESDVDINIPKGKVNENAVAVVIGNRNYTFKDIPQVEFAIHDARAMKLYLMKTFGFLEGNIIYIENGTQASFNATFGTEKNHKGKLFNMMKPNRMSDVFVFYSGHGAPDPESKEGYFVPVDCDPSLVKFNGYSLSLLYENLSKLDYRTMTIVIDACFSGSSDKGMLIKNISPVFINTKDKVLTDDFSMVFTSAASDQVSSWYPEKKHSLFTYYFLKGIQGAANTNGDRWVSVAEMRKYLTDNIPYMARRLNNREQTPQITGDDNKAIVEF